MNINQAIIELYRFTKLNKGLLNYSDIAKIFGCTRGYVAKMAKENKELNEEQVAQLEHRFKFSFFDREAAIKRLEEISQKIPIHIGDYEEFTLYDFQELSEVYNVNLNYLISGIGSMLINQQSNEIIKKAANDDNLDKRVRDLVTQQLAELGLTDVVK